MCRWTIQLAALTVLVMLVSEASAGKRRCCCPAGTATGTSGQMAPAGATAAGGSANGMTWRVVTPPGPTTPVAPVPPPTPVSESDVWNGIRKLVERNKVKEPGGQAVVKDAKLLQQLTPENIAARMADGKPFQFD